MTELEGFSYAVFGVYALTSVGLKAAAYRLGLDRSLPTATMSPLLAFVIAGLWPMLRLSLGEPISPDPLQQRLDGLTGDLVGHALLAAGALTAMMAEVQILTRARVAATSPNEPPAGPVTQKLVSGGRGLQLIGLFLVFPGLVQGSLALTAAIVIAAPVVAARFKARTS
jgi:hypothetical protein